MKRVIAVGVCVCFLSSCATDGQSPSKQDVGTGVGVVLGGLAGSFVGKGNGRIVGVLAGAALGGLIGNQIGKMLDEEDQKALQEQAKQALVNQPDNSSITWNSSHSGATALVTPENTRVESRKIQVVRDANVTPPAQLDLIGTRYQAKSTSNVRLAPSTDADVATTLPAGSTIWAVGKVHDQPWIMVAKGGKSIGYVSAQNLGPVPKPASPKPAANTTASSQPQSAPYDLDATAPVRTPADLDALAPTEKADTIVASVSCRDLKTTATANGQSSTSTQTACKSPDGSWELN